MKKKKEASPPPDKTKLFSKSDQFYMEQYTVGDKRGQKTPEEIAKDLGKSLEDVVDYINHIPKTAFATRPGIVNMTQGQSEIDDKKAQEDREREGENPAFQKKYAKNIHRLNQYKGIDPR